MKRKRRIILIIMTIVAALVITAFIVIKNAGANLEQLSQVAIQDIDLSQKPDGVYHGSYSVFPVSVKVEVRVLSHAITQINLIEHSHGLGTSAEVMPQKVIDAQSLDVDVVSGATYSSKVILKAIEAALS